MELDDLIDQGIRNLEEGNAKAAEKLFAQAAGTEKSLQTLTLLAEAQIELGMLKKAHDNLSLALDIDAEDLDLLYLLGDLYLEENRNAEAIATYQKIIDLDGQDIDAWVSKAMAYVNIDDLEAAEDACRKALKIDPESAYACNALGDICVAMGKKEEAKLSYQHALEIDNSDPQPYVNLAELYYEDEVLEQAEEYCLKGLSVDAGYAPGYLTLGYVCLDLDRSEEAVEHFQQFLRLEQDPAAKQLKEEVSAVIEGLK